MTAICFYFQVHQPFRLRRFTFFDIGRSDRYFDDAENARILRRVAHKCYLPTNAVLLEQVRAHEGRFRCSFSISGTALEQFELWSPETLASFQALAETGCVEFLCETSHHSLAALADPDEFRAQVRNQARRVEELFGVAPTAFRNTELVFSNDIARMVEEEGFAIQMAEGADHLLGWRSPHHLYRPEGTEHLLALLRSYSFSDDIGFRFSNRAWEEWPLDTAKFGDWLEALPEDDEVVGLFMDYETFGEHQWEDTGILEFLRHLPGELLRRGRFDFATPSQVAGRFDPIARLDAPHPVSWADAERDLTAWLGNPMQRAAHTAIHELRGPVLDAEDPALLETWRRLTTSDHFYYMCVKYFSDGDVHKYFSPYASPYDAYITFMNVLGDLRQRLGAPAGLVPTH